MEENSRLPSDSSFPDVVGRFIMFGVKPCASEKLLYASTVGGLIALSAF